MTRAELYLKLEKAQELLCEVYQFAVDSNLQILESCMSMADTMIAESYEEIERGTTGTYLKHLENQ
jgi:hypothetical protein